MKGKIDKQQERGKVTAQLIHSLRDARRRRNLTQEDVSERIGVASEVYGKMERGAGVPRVQTLIKLSRALGVSVDRLLGLNSDDGEAISPFPKEEDLPSEARRVLRVVRELRPEQLKILTTTGCALIEAKEKRRRRRAALGRRADGR